jgi:hypothetical protein
MGSRPKWRGNRGPRRRSRPGGWSPRVARLPASHLPEASTRMPLAFQSPFLPLPQPESDRKDDDAHEYVAVLPSCSPWAVSSARPHRGRGHIRMQLLTHGSDGPGWSGCREWDCRRQITPRLGRGTSQSRNRSVIESRGGRGRSSAGARRRPGRFSLVGYRP